MINFYSIILGIVQGLTEFWPISSSGHLVILHEIFKLPEINNLAFDAIIHLGTLLALVIYFYRDIINLARTNIKLVILILLSVIPAGLAGLFLEDYLTANFRTPLSVAIIFIIVGLLFIVAEKFTKKINTIDKLNWKNILLIACAQALALIPGVSRSGITIIAGLGVNLKREEAARFSFLMSIPIVFIAGSKKTYDLLTASSGNIPWLAYGLGGLSAMVVGIFAIKFLLNYLKNRSLNIFAAYRIIIGLLILAVLFMF